eukprot:SAG31_NODE_23831_length_494_cov_1.939241_2_plen_92_part_01
MFLPFTNHGCSIFLTRHDDWQARDFHEVLTGYLCETLVVYCLRARNLPVKDRLAQSSDPYLLVTLHFGTPDGASTSRTTTEPVRSGTSRRSH